MSVVKIIITANNIHDWPRSSRWLCGWCCHRFSTTPVMVPTWSRTCFHLGGNYCSWNCAKSDTLAKTKAGTFPNKLTAIGLFAFQISFRGRHCPQKARSHSANCGCYTGFTGVVPAPPKEELQDFGGTKSIKEFRRGALTIDSYDWITRYYSPRELCDNKGIKPQYLYTLQPLRRVKLLDEQDEDPVVLIKRRVY